MVAPHHNAAMTAAWISIAVPILGFVLLAFLPAMMDRMTEEIVYWTLFGCGVISLVIGAVAIGMTGMRINWNILTPAILGIVFSAILCYFCLGLGIIDAGLLPRF